MTKPAGEPNVATRRGFLARSAGLAAAAGVVTVSSRCAR